MPKTVLVTGGAGFIGSNIVGALVRTKRKIAVLDDFSTGFKHNLAAFGKRITIVRGDIRDITAVNRVMKGVDTVIHQAAIRSVPKSVDNPLLSHEVNASGTLVLLHAAVKHRVRRFVYASSSSVYGDVKHFPQKESDPLLPLSPYGASKLAAENYCYCFYNNHGLRTVSLRYFNVYGPRQNPESLYSAVVPAFIDKIRQGKPPVVDGSGRQSRDFTYVGDVVAANLRAAFGPASLGGKVFNIASGHDYSVLDILNVIAKNMGVRPRCVFGPPRRGDARRTFADISAARRKLGWKPRVDLNKGLRETVLWFEKEKPGRY